MDKLEKTKSPRGPSPTMGKATKLWGATPINRDIWYKQGWGLCVGDFFVKQGFKI